MHGTPEIKTHKTGHLVNKRGQVIPKDKSHINETYRVANKQANRMHQLINRLYLDLTRKKSKASSNNDDRDLNEKQIAENKYSMTKQLAEHKSIIGTTTC